MIQRRTRLYLNRMQGQRFDPSRHAPKGPTPPSRPTILASTFITSFIGIAITAALTYNAQWFIERNTPVITGAFGATAVLIYGAIDSPLAQPRNVFCGHIMSALVGVSLYKLFNLMNAATFDRLHWLLCSLSVSVSLFLMQLTQTVHPPASATALIAVTGGDTIYNLGYWYVLCPVGLGITMMLTVAIIGNNIARRYPMHWWSAKNRSITIVNQDMSAVIADLVSEDSRIDCCPDSEITGHANPDDDDDNLSTCPTSQVETKKGGATTDTDITSQERRTSLARSNTHSATTEVGSPQSHDSHRHHHHHHNEKQHHGVEQYAVFYEGEQHKDLENGEHVHLRRHITRSSTNSHGAQETSAPTAAAAVAANTLNIDLEQGITHSNCHRRRSTDHSSMRIQKRGSFLTVGSEDHQRTIQELQARIHELEIELARQRDGQPRVQHSQPGSDSITSTPASPSQQP
ncbi:hypothetical protein BGW42_002340 [Actinomortierella wolfii]|nr:hypothetical protein BGW42_002340 [Actinomortierella wolfii]